MLFHFKVIVTLVLIVLAGYMPAPQLSFASHLIVTIKGSTLQVDADNVPLHKILEQISKKADIILKSSDPLNKKVTIKFQSGTIEKGLQRLLSNINHVIYYKASSSNQGVPTEINVFGSRQMRVIKPEANPLSQPDEEQQYYKREWLEKSLEKPDKISTQIAAKKPDKKFDTLLPETGIEITKVEQNSIFDIIGIHQGDIIADINGVSVNSTMQFVTGFLSVEKDINLIRIERINSEGIVDPIYLYLE